MKDQSQSEVKIRNFASDNNSGACPEVLQILEECNYERLRYGDDPWTRRASDGLREIFDTDCEVFFVFNGTAANSLALASTCRSYHSILCHRLAHLETDECGAPEFFSNGSKVLILEGNEGRFVRQYRRGGNEKNRFTLS